MQDKSEFGSLLVKEGEEESESTSEKALHTTQIHHAKGSQQHYGTMADTVMRMGHLYSPDSGGHQVFSLSGGGGGGSGSQPNEESYVSGATQSTGIVDIDEDNELFPLLFRNSKANLNTNLDPYMFDYLYATMIGENEEQRDDGKGYYCNFWCCIGGSGATLNPQLTLNTPDSIGCCSAIGFMLFRKVLLPTNRYLQVWDVLLMFALFWTAVITPYTVCVTMTNERLVTEPIVLVVIDILLDFVFLFDVWVSFRRAYWNGRRLVTEKDKIRNHYVFSLRFIIDLAAAIPFDNIVRLEKVLTAGSSFFGYLRFFLLFRLFRLFRIQAVIGNSVLLRRIHMHIPSPMIGIVRVLMFVLAFNHWGACTWVWIGRYQRFANPMNEASWITLYEDHVPPQIESEMDVRNDFHIYVLALYWAIQTTSSIGYGDVNPHQPIEYVFSVFFMYIGTALQAYSIAMIVGLVNELERERRAMSHRIDEVNSLIEGAHGRIPEEQANRMRYFVQEITKSTAFNQRRRKQDGAIVDVLSKELRDEFTIAETRDWMALIPFLRNIMSRQRKVSMLKRPDEKHLVYNQVLLSLAQKLKWRAFSEGETIDLNEEDGLMIVIHGTIAAGVLKRKVGQLGTPDPRSRRLGWADQEQSPMLRKSSFSIELKRALQSKMQSSDALLLRSVPTSGGKSSRTVAPADEEVNNERTFRINVDLKEQEGEPEARLHTRGAVWGADCISHAASKSARGRHLRRGICVTFVECYYLRRIDIYDAFRAGGKQTTKHLKYLRLRYAFSVWARKVLTAPAKEIFEKDQQRSMRGAASE